MSIKNTLGLAILAFIGAFTLTSCTAPQTNSNGWVCTADSVKEGLDADVVSVIEDVPLTDQCFLQLTKEVGVDANAITLETASSYRELLDDEEHTQMQQFANDYGVEIVYNKLNNTDKVELSPLPGFVASSTKDSRGQYFIASRAWLYDLKTSPIDSRSEPPTDLMDEINAGHLDGWLTADAYLLKAEDRNSLTTDTLTKLLEDNARQLVDATRPHFEPTDISVKNGGMWYPAHITDGKLVINNSGNVSLEPLTDTKYHVTPTAEQ